MRFLGLALAIILAGCGGKASTPAAPVAATGTIVYLGVSGATCPASTSCSLIVELDSAQPQTVLFSGSGDGPITLWTGVSQGVHGLSILYATTTEWSATVNVGSDLTMAVTNGCGFPSCGRVGIVNN